MIKSKLDKNFSFYKIKRRKEYTYTSYGLSPYLWAALLTNHVTFKMNTQRNIVATNHAFVHVSPQQYTGTIVGIRKQAIGIKSM